MGGGDGGALLATPTGQRAAPGAPSALGMLRSGPAEPRNPSWPGTGVPRELGGLQGGLEIPPAPAWRGGRGSHGVRRGPALRHRLQVGFSAAPKMFSLLLFLIALQPGRPSTQGGPYNPPGQEPSTQGGPCTLGWAPATHRSRAPHSQVGRTAATGDTSPSGLSAAPRSPGGGPGPPLTFQSRRMISPSSSSPAATATSTSHSAISAGCSSVSSESTSTENWKGREQPRQGKSSQ